MKPDFWFGLAVVLCGIAIMSWSWWTTERITKIVWDDHGNDWTVYFGGVVTVDQLKKADYYPANQMPLKERVVMLKPPLGMLP